MTKRVSLSILIPTYNYSCTELVSTLVRQAMGIDGLSFEVIVADDGSTDLQTIEANQAINRLPNCRYILKKRNVGRSGIRNVLASMAHYPWLLFIDGDMRIIHPNYLERYLQSDDHAKIVYGGNSTKGSYPVPTGNLRYLYEHNAEQKRTIRLRRQAPCQHFTTSNFMAHRGLLLAHPFNEEIKEYGYEDVLFGKELQDSGVRIQHIDNAVGFSQYESNAETLHKAEQAMRTLYAFRKQLTGYSAIISCGQRIKTLYLTLPTALLFRLLRCPMKVMLCGSHPSLFVFKCYKLGYFVSLCHVSE